MSLYFGSYTFAGAVGGVEVGI